MPIAILLRLFGSGCLLWIGGLLCALILPSAAAAHPLGNFSINQYILVNLQGPIPEIYYLLDMAEIPSFPEVDMIDVNFDSDVTDEEEENYLNAKVPPIVEKIRFHLSGDPIPLTVADRRLSLQEGSGGMVVINILIKLIPLSFSLPSADHPFDLEIISDNFLDNNGVRECKVFLDRHFKNLTPSIGKDKLGYQTEVFADDRGNPVYEDFDCQFLFRFARDTNGPASDTRQSLGFSWTRTARTPADSGDTVMWGKVFPDFAKLSDTEQDNYTKKSADTLDVLAKTQTGKGPQPVLSGMDKGTGLESSPTIVPYKKPDKGDGGILGEMFNRVTDLIRMPDKELTSAMFVWGLGIALIMGMAHARSPGHGKTIMAAYLIGERGTAWNAIVLGIVVTITHTWSVIALGLVTLSAAEKISEEQLSFWLGIASGLIIIIIGVVLFMRRYKHYLLSRHRLVHDHDPECHHSHHNDTDHTHDGGHDHDHHHEHDHDYDHHDDNHSHVIKTRNGVKPSYWNILWLGISGGIVPCPSALIVLLLAIRFGRLQYGLWLIVSFSFGLALVLILIGLMVVYASRMISTKMHGRSRMLTILPVFSSAFITLLGAWIVIWTLLQYNILIFKPGA